MNHHLTIKLPVTELKTAISGLTKVISRHSTLPVLGMLHIERDRHGCPAGLVSEEAAFVRQ